MYTSLMLIQNKKKKRKKEKEKHKRKKERKWKKGETNSQSWEGWEESFRKKNRQRSWNRDSTEGQGELSNPKDRRPHVNRRHHSSREAKSCTKPTGPQSCGSVVLGSVAEVPLTERDAYGSGNRVLIGTVRHVVFGHALQSRAGHVGWELGSVGAVAVHQLVLVCGKKKKCYGFNSVKLNSWAVP